MTRPFQILLILLAAAVISTVAPTPVPADDMVLFKNGRTLRADEIELKDGAYRITTMSGGIMEVPVQLVERVIACVVDKEVEEQRGTARAGTRAPGNTMGGRSSNMTKIPPAGAGGGAEKMGNKSLGGGKVGGGRIGGRKIGGGKSDNATRIPPRGGSSLGKTGGDKSPPEKGKGEGR